MISPLRGNTATVSSCMLQKTNKNNSMAKMSFNEIESEKPETQNVVKDEVTALTAPVDASVALSGSLGNFGSLGIEADVSMDDVRLPRINLLQKMSELVDTPGYSPGDLVFQKEVVLSRFGGTPLEVIFMNLRRQYQEVTPWGSGTEARVVNTREEVFAAGGSLKYKASNEWRPLAHLTCLIKAPEKLNEEHAMLFPFHHDGADYALAMWTVSSSSYTGVATPVITATTQILRDGLWTAKWEIVVNKKSNDQGAVYYTPNAIRKGLLDEGMKAFVSSLMGR